MRYQKTMMAVPVLALAFMGTPLAASAQRLFAIEVAGKAGPTQDCGTVWRLTAY